MRSPARRTWRPFVLPVSVAALIAYQHHELFALLRTVVHTAQRSTAQIDGFWIVLCVIPLVAGLIAAHLTHLLVHLLGDSKR